MNHYVARVSGSSFACGSVLRLLGRVARLLFGSVARSASYLKSAVDDDVTCSLAGVRQGHRTVPAGIRAASWRDSA